MVNCSFDEDNIVPLVINSGAIVVSVLAMVGIITHHKIEESLRGILISFLAANLLAASIFLYDIVTHACEYHANALNFIFKVSMVLSLAHLLLLILHYHIAISSNRPSKVKDFVALILTAWISSATLGCLNAALKQSVSRILIIVVFVLIILIVIKSFHFIKREQQHQRDNTRMYRRRFLQEELEEEKEEMEEDLYTSPPIKQWNLTFVGSITLSTILASIPWLIINVVGLHRSQRRLEHALPLTIYVVSFYVLGVLCVYMRYRDFRHRETEHPISCNSPSTVVEARQPSAVKKSSTADLVSNMETEENYGTFGFSQNILDGI